MTFEIESESSKKGVWTRACVEYRFQIDFFTILGRLKPWCWGSRLDDTQILQTPSLLNIYQKMIPESSRKSPEIDKKTIRERSQKQEAKHVGKMYKK